jgi:hypothetical protein
VLSHVAIAHPNRRARLRDLALLAHAARRCTAEERSGPFLTAGSDYAERLCRTTLEEATGQGDGAAAERRALAMYALATRTPLRFLPPDSRELVDAWSVSMLQTGHERREIWRGAAPEKFKPATQPVIRTVENVLTRVTPALGWSWRVGLRSTYYAATWTVARAVVARAKRTLRGALPLVEQDES